MAERFADLLDGEWKKLQASGGPVLPSTAWSYRVSPPFPSEWPPSPRLALVHYVYAEGLALDGSLVDAVRVAAPWAKVVVDMRGGSGPKFKRLVSKLRLIGTQGVRPLDPDEAIVFKYQQSVEDNLGLLDRLPEDDMLGISQLRRFFCLWLSQHSVLAPEIRAQHEKFFRWLAC